MSDEFVDEEPSTAVAALHQVIRSEEWTYLSGTGAAARGRSWRMRRTRYAATAGSAVAVTGVAVLVASTFGGSGSSQAAPVGGVTHHSSAAPAVPPVPAKTTASHKTTPSQPTMASYYDTWKTCPVAELTVGPVPPGVQAPSTSTKVWVDACRRMVATLSALNPAADVSPAPSGWEVKDAHTRPPGTLGRDEPVPSRLTPTMGPAMYRIEDAKGTVVLSFHSGAHDADKPAGSVPVSMVDGLNAWYAPPKPSVTGIMAMGQLYVASANGQHDSYALLMEAPATYTAEDFKALVTNPKFEQMMADNLAEPNF